MDTAARPLPQSGPGARAGPSHPDRPVGPPGRGLGGGRNGRPNRSPPTGRLVAGARLVGGTWLVAGARLVGGTWLVAGARLVGGTWLVAGARRVEET
ncbi:hypothetical protein [Amycolatopsis sp. PS_44_ISF1]|uniref:hypothetical protein n=1 Tax=Amycolatopsis sp. PS_44_ISF1 TaxID=2974917 RepID=UPI0028DF7682|nr:hypothetical protein [Amycolatopsis sp. PS_44_ISF1]MDT8913101.1 hypothetical protein [Amycolatopsis sp. PS_44_ISF1]